MKIVEKWERNVARSKDYPTKSKELHIDIVITFLGGIFAGIFFGLAQDPALEPPAIILAYAFAISFLATTLFNATYNILPALKFYSSKEPTLHGEEWLRTKRNKSEKQIRDIVDKYWS